jgi:hypothetical protein
LPSSFKRFVSVVAGGLGLLALAVFTVLTNTAAFVITLAVLASIFGLSRLVLAGTRDGPRR